MEITISFKEMFIGIPNLGWFTIMSIGICFAIAKFRIAELNADTAKKKPRKDKKQK